MSSRTVLVLCSLLLLGGCKRAPTTSAEATPPEPILIDEAPTEGPDAWLPADCMAAPVPNSLAAYDCEDGSSFTMRTAKPGVTVPSMLEAQWHEGLSLLEIAGAEVLGTDDRTCVVGAIANPPASEAHSWVGDGPCRVIRARAGDTDARYVVAAASAGDQVLALDCVDLSGAASLHPICARYLQIRE